MESMKYVELNKKGNFERWNPNLLTELENEKALEDISEYIVYQNDSVRLSVIGLESYERVPFKKMKYDFDLFCLTGGLAISRSSDGSIYLLNFDKGEAVSFSLTYSTMVNDLQNIGESTMIFALIEHEHAKVTDATPYYILDGIATYMN